MSLEDSSMFADTKYEIAEAQYERGFQAGILAATGRPYRPRSKPRGSMKSKERIEAAYWACINFRDGKRKTCPRDGHCSCDWGGIGECTFLKDMAWVLGKMPEKPKRIRHTR